MNKEAWDAALAAENRGDYAEAARIYESIGTKRALARAKANRIKAAREAPSQWTSQGENP